MPLSHPRIDMKAKRLITVRIPRFAGQTYHPLPVFSEPVATPPVGQHGKFQLETVTSHKAVKTKPGNAECCEERVHWPAVFLFSQRAPFPFL